MAQIPGAALDYLTSQVNALSADAQAKILRVLESIDWSRGNIAECRSAVTDAIAAVMPGYTDASAQAGADLYDAVRSAATGEALGARALSGYDSEAMDGAVRAFVQGIVDDGDVEEFNRNIIARIGRDIRRSANVSIARNALRDPLKPKFARIPRGGDTCSFCLMLASRGFAYTSPEAAEHCHPDCDCRVIQGYKGMTVEGYDPDALYSDYLDGVFGTFANKRRGSSRGGKVPDYEAYRIMGEWRRRLAEARTIDDLYEVGAKCEAWLKETSFRGKGTRDTVLASLRRAASRRHGELSVGGHPGIVTYTKPRSELLEHERAGIDWLAQKGYDIETIPEIGDAPANLDIRMDGEDWEMKNVTNERSSVSNQISRIRAKWRKLDRSDCPRGIITCEGCSSSFDSVCDGVKLRLKQGDVFIVISSEGEMGFISK